MIDITDKLIDDDDASDSKPITFSRDGKDCNMGSDQLALNETKAVLKLRVAVIFVLVACATAVAVTIYHLTQASENEAFQIQYEGASDKVLKAFEDVLLVHAGALSSLTVAITTQGVDQKAQWPFVTLNSFQRRASVTKILSGATYLSTNHYLEESQRSAWETYTALDTSNYLSESYDYFSQLGIFYEEQNRRVPIFLLGANSTTRDDPGPGPYLPSWQVSPLSSPVLVGINMLRQPWSGDVATLSMKTGLVALGDFLTHHPGGTDSEDRVIVFIANLLIAAEGKPVEYQGDPYSNLYLPIFDSFEPNRKSVASLVAIIFWYRYFEGILPPTDDGILFVLKSCTTSYSYVINGASVKFLGVGDKHDSTFDSMKKSTNFQNVTSIADSTREGLEFNKQHCPFEINVYPTKTFYNDRVSNTPIIVTSAMIITMVFAVLMFLVYDRLVERRQAIVLKSANQSSAIVSSLFPKNVTDRLLNMVLESDSRTMTAKTRLKSFLNDFEDNQGLQPIADLFPETTVLFADIAGFTAWSSTRDPTHVFTLLQSLYQAFDWIAHKEKVFKVETIGDCYVAVTGLPDPQKNHALIMAKFAHFCLQKLRVILLDLELKLGPDTADLGMRFGIHSGPVTAGVLRGERARFQLFGDTVNTAARIESSGHPNKIQVSETTANLIRVAGKGDWLLPRVDKVTAKGKGMVNTYWLVCDLKMVGSAGRGKDVMEKVENQNELNLRKDRMVEWACDLLEEPLNSVLTRTEDGKSHNANELRYKREEGKTFLDETEEVITLPAFDAKMLGKDSKAMLNISDESRKQLRKYVTIIASLYNDNHFHNFEHACHVTMSVSKVLKRVITPDLDFDQIKGSSFESQLHEYTYGITSDPLAVLAIIFSALIHDVDHRGVSNIQLMKEQPTMARTFSNQSVAEQNSLEISWNLLMEDDFAALRAAMFQTKDDMMRFRQVLINVVLATDIFDKGLNDARKKRWQKAFHDDDVPKQELYSLRATIVIEHIIQASDVAHTMQHWHVYQKWNKRLFLEMTKAYRDGRMGSDPACFWYEGELGFFDNYVLPLAKKLKECGVFGVSSDEFLNYAEQNRSEWAERGQEIVADLIRCNDVP